MPLTRLIVGKRFVRRALAGGTAVLIIAAASACGDTSQQTENDGARTTQTPYLTPTPTRAPDPAPTPHAATPDMPSVSKLITDEIAAHRLTGAVVVVGHAGKVVFQRAYGLRKLSGEPGLDGSPAPEEPMTEDTIFDVASLTKPLATATAVMQLAEQGKLRVDDPVQTYLPDFNPSNDPQRAKVTVRMLLTHTSGAPGDLDLRDPWGLRTADKTEGIRRALTTPLRSGPGGSFRYSDIGFIVLGALIEKVTGEPVDAFVQRNVFTPLGMHETRYLPPAKACGPHRIRGAAIEWAPTRNGHNPAACPAGTWSAELLSRIAPTALDEENRGDPGKNPDFGRLLRGTVHDPTARRMGGVAGHAGVFSTGHDVGVYAQALLDRLASRPSKFPLTQTTLELMTTPQQPGSAGPNLRGLGWDIDTGHSKPRGSIFPVGSFGHTGFTGTSLWIDPGSDTYVVLLTNVIHLRGSSPISNLQGAVATAAAHSLGLDDSALPARKAHR